MSNFMPRFDFRNIIKKNLNGKEYDSTLFINQREIRYVHLGENIWFEQNGKENDFRRPALVLRKIGNVFLIIPMTTQWKDKNPFYHRIADNYFGKKSYLIISQVKVIDKKRFINNIGTITEKDFYSIKEKLKRFYF